AADPQIRARRLQLSAPGPLRRSILPIAADGAAQRPGGRLHRRRVPLGRAASARPVARRGRSLEAGRGGHLPGPSPPGRRYPWSLPGDDAPRRQPGPLRPAFYAGDHLSRRGLSDELYTDQPCAREITMANQPFVVHCNREILGGTPVFTGTRVPLRN